jgi:hypothetical protein
LDQIDPVLHNLLTDYPMGEAFVMQVRCSIQLTTGDDESEATDGVKSSHTAMAQMQIRFPAEQRFALDDIRLLRMYIDVCATPGCTRRAEDTCHDCRCYRWCKEHLRDSRLLHKGNEDECHVGKFKSLRDRLAHVHAIKHQQMSLHPVVQGWFKALAAELELSCPGEHSCGTLWSTSANLLVEFSKITPATATVPVLSETGGRAETETDTCLSDPSIPPRTDSELHHLLMRASIKAAPVMREIETIALKDLHQSSLPAVSVSTPAPPILLPKLKKGCDLEAFFQVHCDMLSNLAKASRLPRANDTRCAIFNAKQQTLQRWRLYRESAHEYNQKELINQSQ